MVSENLHGQWAQDGELGSVRAPGRCAAGTKSPWTKGRSGESKSLVPDVLIQIWMPSGCRSAQASPGSLQGMPTCWLGTAEPKLAWSQEAGPKADSLCPQASPRMADSQVSGVFLGH